MIINKMKKALLLSAMLLCGTLAFAQKQSDSTYVSRNGTTFKVGQKITLGLPTGPDDKFKYVNIFTLGLPNSNLPLSGDYASRQAVITKIKRQKVMFFSKDADVTVYLMFKFDKDILNYGINVEPAILAKEIIIAN